MSGETGRQESGWTIDTVKAHLERLIQEEGAYRDERFRASDKAVESALIQADKAVQAALLAAEKAVNKAETAAEKRFESVNEFRAQLADQASTFMPRTEAESRSAALAEKTDDLGARVDGLAARVDKAEGTTKGSQVLFGYAVGAMGVLVGLGGLIAVLVR